MMEELIPFPSLNLFESFSFMNNVDPLSEAELSEENIISVINDQQKFIQYQNLIRYDGQIVKPETFVNLKKAQKSITELYIFQTMKTSLTGLPPLEARKLKCESLTPLLVKPRDLWAVNGEIDQSKKKMALECQTALINNKALVNLKIDKILSKTREKSSSYMKAAVEMEADFVSDMRQQLEDCIEGYNQL